MVQIALMGHGVVGSGVVEVLTKNYESITKKAGNEIRMKYILDLRDFPGHPLEDRFIKDFNIILNDPEIKVVIEVMGGLKPAYQYVKSLLEAGKSVVTSNKELVATCGADLLQTAKDNGVSFLFEASVGGGIPIIRPLHQCLAANYIYSITGILNGTTNYILTKMIKEGIPFATALEQAQKLGYAERDPSADVLGKDSCRKIAILSALSFGTHVNPDRVPTEGITNITLEDVRLAAAYNSVIKLLGRVVRKDNDKIAVCVSPFVIKKDHPLAGVEDVFNAIMVSGDAIGDCMFYGRGAGKLPTASAVVADVIDCVKNQTQPRQIFWKPADDSKLADIGDEVFTYFIRIKSEDKSALESAFSGEEHELISIGRTKESAFIVKGLKEKQVLEICGRLGDKVHSKIRVL